MTDQPTPALRGPIDYAREHAAAGEARSEVWTAEQHAGHGSPCENRPDGSCAKPPADLREQYAAAIYEHNNPGMRWADAHPDDVLAYGADADAVLAVRDRELEQLRAAIARAHHVADLIAAGAPWTASRADTARRIREALATQPPTA